MSTCTFCYGTGGKQHRCPVRNDSWLKTQFEESEWWENRARQSLGSCYRQLVLVSLLDGDRKDLALVAEELESAAKQLVSVARRVVELHKYLVARPDVPRMKSLELSLRVNRLQMHEIETALQKLRG